MWCHIEHQGRQHMVSQYQLLPLAAVLLSKNGLLPPGPTPPLLSAFLPVPKTPASPSAHCLKSCLADQATKAALPSRSSALPSRQDCRYPQPPLTPHPSCWGLQSCTPAWIWTRLHHPWGTLPSAVKATSPLAAPSPSQGCTDSY